MCGETQKVMEELKERKQLLPKLMPDGWLLCCLKHSQIKPLSIFTCNLQMCVHECWFVCVHAYVCAHVHAGTVLYRSITWASDCAISPVSPLCSPRRLILPGGMVLMWEAKGGGDYTHYLSESSSNRMAAASISSLLTSTSNIWSQKSYISLFTAHWQLF